MDIIPLVRTDYPLEPDRANLYQKLTLQYWKQSITEDSKRKELDEQQAENSAPEIISDS